MSIAAIGWEQVQQFLNGISLGQEFYGSTIQEWIIAILAAVVILIVLAIITAVTRKRFDYFAKKLRSPWLRALVIVLEQTKLWFIIALSIWLGSLLLDLSEGRLAAVGTIVFAVFLLQVAVWGSHLIQFVIERNLEERLEKDPAAVTTMSALGFVGKVVLYTVILLLILDNFGKDVTTLIAGLGVGGVAVALAAQKILGDLFSSMSIVLDKPFLLGDFIVVGDMMGTVEKIGLKTTRIRSLSGEQVILSNSDLLDSRIRNYKRMYERRVVFTLGVTYDTPKEKLESIPGMIRAAVESQKLTRFDRAHFAKYGDFALVFEAVYYVLSPDYNLYMDVHQAINLQIFGDFAAREIEFAFPTQTLHLYQESTPAPS